MLANAVGRRHALPKAGVGFQRQGQWAASGTAADSVGRVSDGGGDGDGALTGTSMWIIIAIEIHIGGDV